jgi:hypothetical protein
MRQLGNLKDLTQNAGCVGHEESTNEGKQSDAGFRRDDGKKSQALDQDDGV